MTGLIFILFIGGVLFAGLSFVEWVLDHNQNARFLFICTCILLCSCMILLFINYIPKATPVVAQQDSPQEIAQTNSTNIENPIDTLIYTGQFLKQSPDFGVSFELSKESLENQGK